MLHSNKWKAAVAALCLGMTIMVLMEMSLIPRDAGAGQTVVPRNVSSADAVQMSSTSIALVPGELPGYTGWARPEYTFAPFFTIQSISTRQPIVGKEFSVRLSCHRSLDCVNGTSMFYLRAYGPSVISGIWQRNGRGRYTAVFNFPDPGLYTVEVVLTFSNPPPIEKFPLSLDRQEPAYEGYLLPGFPLIVSVEDEEISVDNKHLDQSTSLCKADELLETSPTSAATKARWKVVQKSNAPEHFVKSNGISKQGYLQNVNSLGIGMDYQYRSGCSLIPPADFEQRPGGQHPFSQCGPKKLHIIFVGDSVMRVQKAMFDSMIDSLPNIQTSYVTLYGGYRRVVALERAFHIKLEDIHRRAADDIKIVLFNSGLHDVHRLCSSEWKTDRYEYLDSKVLDSGTFSCTEEYKSLIQDLASAMMDFDAEFRIFQSTSSAWPKYGNFGIEWPLGGQMMPVATDVIPAFNEIAFDVLEDKFKGSIGFMDGYWITYTRPDNREIGTIGRKLSHPGLEVQSAMSRIWAMVILEKFCNAGS